jgi:hypothetical protein
MSSKSLFTKPEEGDEEWSPEEQEEGEISETDEEPQEQDQTSSESESGSYESEDEPSPSRDGSEVESEEDIPQELVRKMPEEIPVPISGDLRKHVLNRMHQSRSYLL